jgi:hypothetical protein
VSHHPTILAHLLDWACSNRYEDAATEGLAYVLQRHEALRRRFIEVLQGFEPKLAADLRFSTQQPAGGGRVDMAGRSADVVRVLVENKFGASLTVNQPLEYLRSLRETPGVTLLLFIAPAPRKEALWQELLGSLSPESWPQAEVEPFAVKLVGPQGSVRLAILAWQDLFVRLREGAPESAGADLTQLVGLCFAGEERGWRPFEAEELSDRQIPQRMIHYLEVVRDALGRAPAELLVQPSRSDSHGWGWCGYKFHYTGPNVPSAWLGFSLWRWREYGVGPVWLHFERRHLDRIEARLRDWCEAQGRVFSRISDGAMIPIVLRTRCDTSVVVDDIVAQLREIRDLLVAPTGSVGAPA